MNISNIEIDNSLFLAPMAGVTDKPFRVLCKMLGAGLTYTEMVSVKGLYYKSKKTEELLAVSPLEHPCAVQLFGHEPEIFASVIKSGVLDKFDIIDINMGCPAPKIVKNGDGSALMKDVNLASQIIKACVQSTNKPITVKFRKGFKKSDDKLIEFAKMCEASGASAITIHPRTREDMFSGEIDLEDIKKVKQSVNIPVIGNGDVTTIEDYNKMIAVCDGVMIGRASLKTPELFLEINNMNGKQNTTFFKMYKELVDNSFNLESNLQTKPTKLQIIKMHIVLLKQDYSNEHIVKIFKKFALSYLSGFNSANEIKRKIVMLNSLEEMLEELETFFTKGEQE